VPFINTKLKPQPIGLNLQQIKRTFMKALFTILILTFNLAAFAQADIVAGDYTRTIETKESNKFDYNLVLYKDGTFSFHYYSNIKQGNPPEVNKFGKGKWTLKNNVVSFFSDKQKDFDEKHTLDFKNSKARFVIKSPRDKTETVIKTRLTVLSSEIFWMQGLELFKI
jgi:hypothetical protein